MAVRTIIKLHIFELFRLKQVLKSFARIYYP